MGAPRVLRPVGQRGLRPAPLLAVLAGAAAALSAAVSTAATPPVEGIAVQGSEVITAPADRFSVTVLATATAQTTAEAEAALETSTRDVLARLSAAAPTIGAAPEPVKIATLPTQRSADSRSWIAKRELRATVASGPAQSLLPALAAQPGVTVVTVTATHGDLDGLRRTAIERATAAAQARGETAARGLGFALGTVRDVVVKTDERRSETMIDVEARVDVRYALAPATSRTEVLAIAAAASAAASTAAAPTAAAPSTTAMPTPASRDAGAPQPLEVEVVSAVYDATGRGRFTTATGTVWREVVPAPADQRLKPTRRYRGTITLGVISGYRMQLEGVPRILKVAPVGVRPP